MTTDSQQRRHAHFLLDRLSSERLWEVVQVLEALSGVFNDLVEPIDSRGDYSRAPTLPETGISLDNLDDIV